MTTRNIKIFNANRAFGDATSNTPILEAGSLTWDLSNGLRLHDGTTAGGNQIATGGGGFTTTSTLINGAYAVSLNNTGILTAGTISVVGEGTGITVDASAGMNRTGFMKYYGIEGAFVHGSTNPLRFGRVSVPDITTATYNIFTTEIFISTAGLVGINTTTPGERFDVGGNIQLSGSLKFSADGSIQTTAWTGSTSTLISSDGSSVASLTVLYNGANSAPELRPGGHYDLGSVSYKLRDVWADGSIGPANSITFANASSIAQSGNDIIFNVNGAQSWNFSSTGTLTTPGPIEVQGAGSDITGVGTIEGIGSELVLKATDGTTTSTWTFSNTGTVTFPNTTVQSTAYQLVDPPVSSTSTGYVGQIAFNNSFSYYCVAINTWKRTAWTDTSW